MPEQLTLAASLQRDERKWIDRAAQLIDAAGNERRLAYEMWRFYRANPEAHIPGSRSVLRLRAKEALDAARKLITEAKAADALDAKLRAAFQSQAVAAR